MSRWASLVLASLVIGCTAPAKKKDTLLEPSTWDAADEPRVVSVASKSEVASTLEPGDKLVAIGNQPVSSYQSLLEALSDSEEFDGSAMIRTTEGEKVELPVESVLPGSDGKSPVLWLEPGSTSIYESYTNINDEKQVRGVVWAGGLGAAISARHWKTDPPLIEVSIVVQAHDECGGCGLKDLRVLDLSKNSWVHPIAIAKAAQAVYPSLGPRGQTVAVPPPTPAGGTAFSSTYGTVDAYSYGNSTYGAYQGTTTTTYTQNYDYGATNAAQFHNLGVAIRNARIRNQRDARSEFVTKRRGNLRVGELRPGEMVQGHVFFALPPDFDGPYGIEVVNQEDEVAWLRFEKPVSKTPASDSSD